MGIQIYFDKFDTDGKLIATTTANAIMVAEFFFLSFNYLSYGFKAFKIIIINAKLCT